MLLASNWKAICCPSYTDRRDIYSPGATLYALRTGRPPLEGPTPEDRLRDLERVAKYAGTDV
jgi:serine/threonine protein kinase